MWTVAHLGIHSPGKFITDILHSWAQKGNEELWIHFSYQSTGGGSEHVIVSFLPIESLESSEDDRDTVGTCAPHYRCWLQIEKLLAQSLLQFLQIVNAHISHENTRVATITQECSC